MLYAVAIAGGEERLARYLYVSVPQLDNWLHGIEDIPSEIFLAAVDVVIGASREEIARSRERLPRIARSTS